MFIFVNSQRTHSDYNCLLGTKSPKNKRPKYLDIIDYVLEHPREAFRKEDLVNHSSYKAKCIELFTSFNENKILEYKPGYPYYGWVRGSNFDLWRKEYYPESLVKYPVEDNSKMIKKTINEKIKQIQILSEEIAQLSSLL